MCDCKNCKKCADCVEDAGTIPDWVKIKAYREGHPKSVRTDLAILASWGSVSDPIHALARRISRDDTPPVSQELLIWREAWARYWEYNLPLAKDYREGLRDGELHEGAVKTAIKLALEGYGKDGKCIY